MNQQTKSVETKNLQKKGWMLFVVSAIALTLLFMFKPEVFWLALPTTVGGLVMGLDWV
ncbi:MAG: hypothetical protein H7321_05080 [Bacteroidia bacterium]|nr:hypothetical protein [Bacteroidia bacterium]